MSGRRPQSVRYKRIGRCGIGADIYRQPGIGPHPLIIWIHGGALIGGSRRDLDGFQLERYLDAGFAVLSVDYRLAPETKLPLIVSDVADAIAWARSEGSSEFAFDGTRMAVVGHSAGGYLAHWAAAVVRPRLQAAVTFYGYGDVVPEWYLRPSDHYLAGPRISEDEARAGVGERVLSHARSRGRWQFYRYCRQQGTWPFEVVGEEQLEDPEGLRRLRPALLVTAGHPATLLIHGDKDSDVPFGASVEMAEAFVKHEVTHEFFAAQGRDHGFDSDPNDPLALVALERAASFLREHFAVP